MASSSPTSRRNRPASAGRAGHDLRTLPTTAAGRLSLVLAIAFSALFAWVVLLDPVVGTILGRDSTPVDGDPLPSLLLVLLVDAAAVTGLVARRRGERAVLGQALLWGCLVLAVLWTGIIGGSFLSDG